MDLSTFSEVFRFLDRDGDGKLSDEDLQTALGVLDISKHSFDKDPTGLDLSLFMAMVSSKLLPLKASLPVAKDSFRVLVDNNFSPESTLVPLDKLYSLLAEHSLVSDGDWEAFISFTASIDVLSAPQVLDYQKLLAFFA